jgi:hypothetical protein
MVVSARIVNPDPESGFITVVLDGERHSINAGNTLFSKALDAYKADDWDAFVACVNPTIRLKSLYASYEGIEVKDGNLYVFGDPVHSTLANRVLSFLEHGLDCVHLFKFILKLNLNPSKRAVDELYTFLEHRALPITDNGNFLAYKAVRADYTDKHTGKFLNTVDAVLEMPRNKVDDDKNVGCSYGFHAGTVEYAKDFMDRDGHLMIVEINPADVVSIPTDCQFQKLRTCKYKVVGEYEIDLTDPMYASRFQTDDDDDVDVWNDSNWDSCDECECCPMECDKCLCCNDCCGCKSDKLPTCSDCGEESYGNCDNCDCCEGCCDCSSCNNCGENIADLDEDGYCKDCQVEPNYLEINQAIADACSKTEVQLTLNLDNKMQSVDWKKQTVNLIKLVGHLFSSRRPALAMSIRREFDNYDDTTRIAFEVLLHHTTEDDVKRIYNELNP